MRQMDGLFSLAGQTDHFRLSCKDPAEMPACL